MTGQELYQILSELTPDQRQQEVIVSPLDGRTVRDGKLDSLWVPKEDLINPSGEALEPESVYRNEDEEDDYSDEPIRVKAGSVLLLVT